MHPRAAKSIAISPQVRSALGLMAASERADFLHSLTDDVARLVLKNSHDQNVLLVNDRALVQNWSPGFNLNWSPGFERTMDWLERAIDLDRGREALPTTDQFHARLQAGKELTSTSCPYWPPAPRSSSPRN